MTKHELIKNLDILFSLADEPTVDRDFILNEVANTKIYNEVIERYIPFDLEERSEFKQYLFEILCTKPNQVIEDLWNKKQFMYWYVGIIRNSIISSSSPWHRKHRTYDRRFKQYALDSGNDSIENELCTFKDEGEYQKDFLKLNPVDDSKFEIDLIEDENERQMKLKLVDDAIAYHLTKNPSLKTEFDLFKLYYKNNLSYREISKMSHIPLTACFQYIQTALVLVKKYITNKEQKIK